MADTAHKTAEEICEHFDAPKVLDAKIDQVVALLKNSSFPVCWTGAGISTSCGVPDFRGPNGKWTLQAQGKQRDPSIKVVDTTVATPSKSHMALVSMMNHDVLKRVISTNTDGLHRRSGIDPRKLAELHGCGQKMRCDKCYKWAFLDARCRVAAKVHDHKTNQKCPHCKVGVLCDTIINFGEYLHEETTDLAEKFGAAADLLFVLGSSLRVITCEALDHIEKKRRKGKGHLVICNLQKTPYDDQCTVRIWAKTDDFMIPLMQRLGLPIPEYKLQRICRITNDASDGRLTMDGEDPEGNPYAWAQSCALHQYEKVSGVDTCARNPQNSNCIRPLSFAYNERQMKDKNGALLPSSSTIVIEPTKLRGEAPLKIPIDSNDLSENWSRKYVAIYDPSSALWEIQGSAASNAVADAAPKASAKVDVDEAQ